MSKKIIMMGMLAIFMLSIVPGALAELRVNQNVQASANSDVTIEGIDSENNATLEAKRELRDERRQRINDRRDNLRASLHDAREKFNQARQRFAEMKENHKERTKALLEMRQEVRDCEENCDELKAQLRVGVAMHLENTLAMMEKSLAKLDAKIQDSNLPDEEKKQLLIQVADLQTKVDAKQELDLENMSAEEIKSEIAATKELYQEIKAAHKAAVADLAIMKLGVLLEKHQNLALRMQNRIDTLEKEGHDVSAMVEVKAKFDTHVTDLEAKYEQAQREGTAYFRENFGTIKQELKETRQLLREFMQAQKQAKSSVEFEAQVDTTLEE